MPAPDIGRNTLQCKSSMLLLAEGALSVRRKRPLGDPKDVRVRLDLVLHAWLSGPDQILRNTPAEAAQDLVDLSGEHANDTAWARFKSPRCTVNTLAEFRPKQAKPSHPHLPHDGRGPHRSGEDVANQPRTGTGPPNWEQVFHGTALAHDTRPHKPKNEHNGRTCSLPAGKLRRISHVGCFVKRGLLAPQGRPMWIEKLWTHKSADLAGRTDGPPHNPSTCAVLELDRITQHYKPNEFWRWRIAGQLVFIDRLGPDKGSKSKHSEPPLLDVVETCPSEPDQK